MSNREAGKKRGRGMLANGEVKQELLQAAKTLLSMQGREGATMRAICAEVGVTPPTLYHHFGDLQGLHKAAIDETYLQVAAAYHEGTEEKGPLKGIRHFHSQGLLSYPPRQTAQLLWIAALGALTYAVSHVGSEENDDLLLQKATLDITLAALFNVAEM